MKAPEKFPLKFHGIIGMGEGEWLLSQGEERKELECTARHFRDFLKALILHENHAFKGLLQSHTIKTRITLNVWSIKFLLHVSIKKRWHFPAPIID